ncbi:hypothetical protein Bbelb_070350 [Branchiostoma belcheri]|nr:hypothetical protein Bbelb_070350 [Branchiostoma belcheri]
MDDACPKKVGSKRKRQRQYCGHCNQELGNTAYYLHKKQFFKDGVWRQAALFGGSKGPTDMVDNGASCPIATQEHGEGDFYTEDTLDDDGLELPDTSSAENDGFDVGEGETNGWLEDEDLRLFLSDTGSDTDSSDQGDACYEERDIREDVDDQEEPEIWSGEAPTGEEFVAVDNSATGESDTPGGLNRDDFVKFVVCPKCRTRYTMEEAYRTKANGEKVSRKCEFVPFYSHPHRRSELRRKCGTVLMKKVKSINGDGEYLYPKSTFCYKSVVESLQELVSKPSFQEKCEQWRERDVSGTGMTDVYDGKVWNEFQYVNGTPFLAEPNNLALMLNCDWYQPYKHSEYSVGVLYLVVLNLPREERFKEENMIVVGLIPGPKEPKIDINSFLEPLVDELQDLWKGVLLSDNSVLGAQLYRAALVCLSSHLILS